MQTCPKPTRRDPSDTSKSFTSIARCRSTAWSICLVLLAVGTEGSPLFRSGFQSTAFVHPSPVRSRDVSQRSISGLRYRPAQQNGSSPNTRTNRRPTKLERIKKCRSVREVQRICSRGSSINRRSPISESSSSSSSSSSPPLVSVHPMIAAAALRRVSDLRSISLAKRRNRRRTNAGVQTEDDFDDNETKIARELLPELLQIVGKAVISDIRATASHREKDDDSPTEDQRKQLGPISLLDLLYSLAKLSDNKKRSVIATADDDGRGSSIDKGGGSFRPLAEATCKAISSDDAGKSYIKHIWHTSLVETIWALAKLDLRQETTLIDAIGDRIQQGDACGRLSGRQLSTLLWAYAVLERPHAGIMKASMRRLRKVRSGLPAWVIARTVWASARLVDRLDDPAPFSGDDVIDHDVISARMREEAETLAFTLSEELLCPVADDDAHPKLLDLTAGNVADILSAFSALELGDSVPIVSALSCHIGQQDVLDRCSIQDVSRILLSFQRMGLRSEVEAITLLGDRFAALTKVNGCGGKTLNTVLRAVSMLVRPGDSSRNSVFDAASELILESGSPFLSKCNEYEVASILWSFAQAQCVNTGVMMKLADRIMENDIVGQCSPSSASRMLWSFTVLISLFDEEDENISGLRDKQFQLFQSLGGIMLSSQLTPMDCSRAMWAMAKASYPLDMAVFDHLAVRLAVDEMLERSSVRQISEALWACGRMSNWEGKQDKDMSMVLIPPYMESAKKYVATILARRDELSPKDVSQAIWSLGRLYLLADIADDFALLAEAVAPKCNGIEISGILFGLSRLGYTNAPVIEALTDRFTAPSVLESCSAREISTVMVALGNIQYRNPELFSVLSTALMNNIHSASSESIASALSAYEDVNIVPPRVLFDCWASEKLGITARHSYISQVVGDAIATPVLFNMTDEDDIGDCSFDIF